MEGAPRLRGPSSALPIVTLCVPITAPSPGRLVRRVNSPLSLVLPLALGPFPSGRKVTPTFGNGCPAKVIVPFTGAVLGALPALHPVQNSNAVRKRKISRSGAEARRDIKQTQKEGVC